MARGLVVITGASSGIGAATAKMFAELGHPMLLLARRMDRMAELGLEKAMLRPVDVRDLDAVKAALAEAEAEFGPVEVVVNNAGMMLLGKGARQDVNEWQVMAEVNLGGVFNLVHAVLPGMAERGSGTIVNISSVAGRKTYPNHAAYCATKHAVHAFSENLREEVADKGVRVVVIAPGTVETELIDHTSSERTREAYRNWREDIGGGLQPEDIAGAIRFAVEQPENICVREIVIAPTGQQG